MPFLSDAAMFADMRTIVNFLSLMVLLTCDEGLLKRAKRPKLTISLMNPVDYVRQEDDDDGTN